MSNLIKSDQHPLFAIQSFEGEEFRRGSPRGRGGVAEPGSGSSSDPGAPRYENPQERLDRLEREAYEKGFEQGQREGMILGEKRLEQRVKQMESLLRELGTLKRRLFLESEGELLKLSLEIARHILRSEVKTDPAVITRALRAAVEHLADRSRIRILVHPDDMAELHKTLTETAESCRMEQWELVEDRSIERGGCFLESGFGRVNATIDEQLQAVAEELQQEFAARPEGDGGDPA